MSADNREKLRRRIATRFEGTDNDSSVHVIMRVVADYYDLTRAHLTRKYVKKAVRARHMIMYLARTMSKASFPEIAYRLNVDHTTVMYGVRKVARDLKRDIQLVHEVEAIRSILREQSPIQLGAISMQCPTCGHHSLDPVQRKEMVADLREQLSTAMARIELLEKVA